MIPLQSSQSQASLERSSNQIYLLSHPRRLDGDHERLCICWCGCGGFLGAGCRIARRHFFYSFLAPPHAHHRKKRNATHGLPQEQTYRQSVVCVRLSTRRRGWLWSAAAGSSVTNSRCLLFVLREGEKPTKFFINVFPELCFFCPL